MKKFVTLSIVIPVYNEGRFIERTIKQVMAANCLGMNKEVIVVDDGSKDNTPQILNMLGKKFKLKVISLPKNQGKGAALKNAFLKTTGDIVIIQDADLEYTTDDYPNLLEPFLKNNADAVYGSRLVTAAPHRVLYFWHYLSNRALTEISNVFTNLNLTDMETGSKLFRGDIIRKIAPKLKSKRFGFEPEITARLSKIKGIKIFEIGISYSGRTYEEGKKITWTDGIKALFQIIRYNIFD